MKISFLHMKGKKAILFGSITQILSHGLKRPVAFKFLPLELIRDPKTKERFIHEAQAASALQHNNICTIHEIDETEDGQMFICMDYYEGETLKKKLERRLLKLEEAIDIAIQNAEGLTKAHQKGIIHRDIKPANIFVTNDGIVKILDFGLAKLAGRTKLTKVSTTLGTVAYMSPEQTRGEEIDHRTDIWSLGVVIYEMLTGQLPFKGDYEQAVVYSILNEEPKPITSLRTGVPMELERIVNKALAKVADDRYPHVDDMLVDLKSLKKQLETRKAKEPPVKTKLPRRKPVYFYAGLAVLVALAILIGIFLFPEQRETIDAIAVLPLKNISGDPEQEYFAEGMTEALITELSKIKALRVISRTSAMRYKDTDKSLPEIAEELRVGALVEGSALIIEERIRITAQLIEAATDQHIWAEDYERDFRDILSLQKEVARTIAREIAVQLTPQDKTRIGKAQAIDPEAYKLYLKGLQFRYKEESQKAAEYFEQSIAKDPNFAPAYARLAWAYLLLAGYGVLPREEAELKGKQVVTKALELDETLSDVYVAKALNKCYYDWDWAGAERAFQRAIELNPGNCDAHWEYGVFLVDMGKFEEGLAEAKQGVELDPLSGQALETVALAYYRSRQYDQAIKYYKMALEPDPNYLNAQMGLGLAYLKKGMYEKAIDEFEKSVALARHPWHLGFLGHAYAVSGKREEALNLLNEIKEQKIQGDSSVFTRYLVSWIYAGLGDWDPMLAWLEQAYEERFVWLVPFIGDPFYDPIRSDQRFQSLLKKVGLEP